MWAFVSHLVAENLPASILHELSDHSFENYPLENAKDKVLEHTREFPDSRCSEQRLL